MMESLLDDEEDLGFVEIDDFVQLQNCFDDNPPPPSLDLPMIKSLRKIWAL